LLTPLLFLSPIDLLRTLSNLDEEACSCLPDVDVLLTKDLMDCASEEELLADGRGWFRPWTLAVLFEGRSCLGRREKEAGFLR
jgi:hypothetical protein